MSPIHPDRQGHSARSTIASREAWCAKATGNRFTGSARRPNGRSEDFWAGRLLAMRLPASLAA